jgi:DNA 3'-phosphatase
MDGTIIETASGKTFPMFLGDMKFKEGILEAIAKFVKTDGVEYVFIVTNQGGIDAGFVTSGDMRTKCSFICDCIADFIRRSGYDKPVFIAYRFCSSEDVNDECRKPNTGMLKHIIRDSASVSVPKDEMIMVGDASGLEGQFSDSDKKTAENFGIDYLDVDEFIALTTTLYKEL